MSASDRRLSTLFGIVTPAVAAVVALAIVSFVVVLVLAHVGDHSLGVTTVTTTP